MKDKGPDFLTTKEAAAELGITSGALRYHIKNGSLPAKNIGGWWLVQREDLDRFKQLGRRKGTETTLERYGRERYREISRKGVGAAKEHGAGVLTTKEAADEIGVTPIVLRYHIQNGNLAAERLGRFWVVRREDLESFKKPGRCRIAETLKERYGPDYMKKSGRKGGATTAKRHGPEFFKKIGQKGGRATKERHGDEPYEEIGRKGTEAAVAKRRQEKG